MMGGNRRSLGSLASALATYETRGRRSLLVGNYFVDTSRPHNANDHIRLGEMQRIGKAHAAEGYSAILILRICHGGCDGGGANARVVSMAALLGIAGRGGDAAPGYARLKVRPLNQCASPSLKAHRSSGLEIDHHFVFSDAQRWRGACGRRPEKAGKLRSSACSRPASDIPGAQKPVHSPDCSPRKPILSLGD
jgi:hypothetical protein